MNPLPFILAHLFLDTGLAYHQPNPQLEAGYYWTYDANKTANPYAVIALGEQVQVRPYLNLSFEARHESSIATGYDRGQNSLQLTLRWSLPK